MVNNCPFCLSFRSFHSWLSISMWTCRALLRLDKAVCREAPKSWVNLIHSLRVTLSTAQSLIIVRVTSLAPAPTRPKPHAEGVFLSFPIEQRADPPRRTNRKAGHRWNILRPYFYSSYSIMYRAFYTYPSKRPERLKCIAPHRPSLPNPSVAPSRCRASSGWWPCGKDGYFTCFDSI